VAETDYLKSFFGLRRKNTVSEVPYFEDLINDYQKGIISKSAFNQLLLKDEKLREWFQLHQILEKSSKNNNGGLQRQRKSDG